MSNNVKQPFYKKIPGWAVMLALFGVLYITGLHTEAIGQVQRLLLATGIRNANVPEQVEKYDAQSDGSTMVGADFLMKDLSGKTISFESLKGRVVFLNIWATWCPPCIAEMPSIQSLYESVDKDKVAFVMLSVDKKGMEKVKKFIERKDYTFPVYLPASQLPQEFQSNAIPTTFIISPAGQIVSRHEGMADYDTDEVKEFLKKLYN